MLGLGEAGGRLAADLAAAGAEVHGYDPVAVSTPEGVARAPSPAEAVAGSEVVLAEENREYIIGRSKTAGVA